MKTIINPAIKYKFTNEVFGGKTYADCYNFFVYTHGKDWTVDNIEEGFVTSDREFVGKEEALKIAKESGMNIAHRFLSPEDLEPHLEEAKFIVIKREDLSFMSSKDIFDLERVFSAIAANRKQRGKELNKYLVVNLDESYADKVFDLIMEGERNKRVKGV